MALYLHLCAFTVKKKARDFFRFKTQYVLCLNYHLKGLSYLLRT